MSQETERRVQGLDGTALRVRVVPAASPKGCVVVVHGIDDHLERYSALAAFLHESAYDVVLYDQRGHGASGGTRTHVEGFSDYLDDLERVCDTVLSGRAPPHLFGHSMGSVVALLAAMRNPERWRSVIVQGFPASPGRNIPKALEGLVRALRPLVSALRARTGIDAEQLSRDSAVVHAYRADPLVVGRVTLGWGAEFVAALRQLREGVSSMLCPLLILHGESDTVARPEGSRWLAIHAGAKDRKLITYPGLKHELHNELPPDRARVFADILAWLTNH